MDALVPAFVAALLIGIGDRPARLAALLGAHCPIRSVAVGLVLGQAAAIALSVAGAFVIAPLLTPDARALLLAMALVLAALTVWWRRRVAPPGYNRPVVMATTGSFVTGDATAFLAFALAVKGSAPVLAGVGALAGALVITLSAAAMAQDWDRLPLILFSRIAGVLLLATGLVVAVGALGLV